MAVEVALFGVNLRILEKNGTRRLESGAVRYFLHSFLEGQVESIETTQG
jgi:hypothetical protein